MALRELIARFGIDVDTKKLTAATHKTDALVTSLQRVGGALLAAGGIRAAGKAFIGFNANIEETQESLATVLGIGRKTGIAEQLDSASAIVTRLQREMAEVPGTTLEAVKAAKELAIALAPLDKSNDDITDLAKSVTIAAKSLGEEMDVALRDFRQGIQRGVESDDPFGRRLLEIMGMGDEAGRAKFKGMSPQQRAAIFEEALNSKAIQEAGIRRAKTFAGAFEFATADIQQRLGQIGKSVFEFTKRFLIEFNRITKGTKYIESALIAFGAVAVMVARRTLIAWAPMILKFTLVAAAAFALWIAIDDLATGLEGGRSRIAEWIDAWAGLEEGSTLEALRAMGKALEWIVENTIKAVRGLSVLFDDKKLATAMTGMADFFGGALGVDTAADKKLARLKAEGENQRAALKASRDNAVTNNIVINAGSANAREVAAEVDKRIGKTTRVIADSEPVR